MKKSTFLMAMVIACTVAFAQQPETIINDWEGNTYPNYEQNIWSNPNCWCVWASDVVNPSADGINTSANAVSYPAHNWLDQTWWYYQEGMLAFKQLPTSYLQDHQYLYLEYLVGDDVTYAGVASEVSPVGYTIKMKLKFRGASSDADITTEVLWELPITADDLNTWKALTLEIPEAVRNSDFTILNIFTGIVQEEEVEIEFYYDNIGFSNTSIPTAIANVPVKNNFNVFMDGDICNIRMDEPTMLKSIGIYNMAGSLMYQKSLNTEARDFTIPLNLASGIYVVKLDSGSQAYTKKIIVQ